MKTRKHKIASIVLLMIFFSQQISWACGYNLSLLINPPPSPLIYKDHGEFNRWVAKRVYSLAKPSFRHNPQDLKSAYQWLKTPATETVPCSAYVLYNLLLAKGINPKVEDISASLISLDLKAGNLKPPFTASRIDNSLYAMAKTAESQGLTLYPARLNSITPELLNSQTPFIVHLSYGGQSGHFVLVTKIDTEKVYFLYDKGDTFLPYEKFLKEFSGYCLLSAVKDFSSVSDSEAKSVLGAGRSYNGRSVNISSLFKKPSALESIIGIGTAIGGAFTMGGSGYGSFAAMGINIGGSIIFKDSQWGRIGTSIVAGAVGGGINGGMEAIRGNMWKEALQGAAVGAAKSATISGTMYGISRIKIANLSPSVMASIGQLVAVPLGNAVGSGLQWGFKLPIYDSLGHRMGTVSDLNFTGGFGTGFWRGLTFQTPESFGKTVSFREKWGGAIQHYGSEAASIAIEQFAPSKYSSAYGMGLNSAFSLFTNINDSWGKAIGIALGKGVTMGGASLLLANLTKGMRVTEGAFLEKAASSLIGSGVEAAFGYNKEDNRYPGMSRWGIFSKSLVDNWVNTSKSIVTFGNPSGNFLNYQGGYAIAKMYTFGSDIAALQKGGLKGLDAVRYAWNQYVGSSLHYSAIGDFSNIAENRLRRIKYAKDMHKIEMRPLKNVNSTLIKSKDVKDGYDGNQKLLYDLTANQLLPGQEILRLDAATGYKQVSVLNGDGTVGTINRYEGQKLIFSLDLNKHKQTVYGQGYTYDKINEYKYDKEERLGGRLTGTMVEASKTYLDSNGKIPAITTITSDKSGIKTKTLEVYGENGRKNQETRFHSVDGKNLQLLSRTDFDYDDKNNSVTRVITEADGRKQVITQNFKQEHIAYPGDSTKKLEVKTLVSEEVLLDVNSKKRNDQFATTTTPDITNYVGLNKPIKDFISLKKFDSADYGSVEKAWESALNNSKSKKTPDNMDGHVKAYEKHMIDPEQKLPQSISSGSPGAAVGYDIKISPDGKTAEFYRQDTEELYRTVSKNGDGSSTVVDWAGEKRKIRSYDIIDEQRDDKKRIIKQVQRWKSVVPGEDFRFEEITGAGEERKLKVYGQNEYEYMNKIKADVPKSSDNGHNYSSNSKGSPPAQAEVKTMDIVASDLNGRPLTQDDLIQIYEKKGYHHDGINEGYVNQDKYINNSKDTVVLSAMGEKTMVLDVSGGSLEDANFKVKSYDSNADKWNLINNSGLAEKVDVVVENGVLRKPPKDPYIKVFAQQEAKNSPSPPDEVKTTISGTINYESGWQGLVNTIATNDKALNTEQDFNWGAYEHGLAQVEDYGQSSLDRASNNVSYEDKTISFGQGMSEDAAIELMTLAQEGIFNEPGASAIAARINSEGWDAVKKSLTGSLTGVRSSGINKVTTYPLVADFLGKEGGYQNPSPQAITSGGVHYDSGWENFINPGKDSNVSSVQAEVDKKVYGQSEYEKKIISDTNPSATQRTEEHNSANQERSINKNDNVFSDLKIARRAGENNKDYYTRIMMDKLKSSEGINKESADISGKLYTSFFNQDGRDSVDLKVAGGLFLGATTLISAGIAGISLGTLGSLTGGGVGGLALATGGLIAEGVSRHVSNMEKMTQLKQDKDKETMDFYMTKDIASGMSVEDSKKARVLRVLKNEIYELNSAPKESSWWSPVRWGEGLLNLAGLRVPDSEKIKTLNFLNEGLNRLKKQK